MKIFTTILLFTFINLSFSQEITEDDGLHVLTGAAISSGTYAFVYSRTQNKSKAFWYSLGLSSLAGLTKEVLDETAFDGYFDTTEFASTILGGLTASYTFNVFTGKRKKKKQEEKKLVYQSL